MAGWRLLRALPAVVPHPPTRLAPCASPPARPQQDDGTTAATIGNPATAEFEVCRTSLLPGALKTLGALGAGAAAGQQLQLAAATRHAACGPAVQRVSRPHACMLGWARLHAHRPAPPTGSNKDAPLPVRLFEVSDVILLSADKGCGAANARRLVAVHCDRAAPFEVIHGLLNRLMEVLGVPHAGA